MDQTPPLLAASGIVKRYGDFAANDRVDLTIEAGEIHALLGENGAGKSTLVKMIHGVMQPDEGHFEWQGTRRRIDSPAAARALGIGMVFQHFSVFEALSVAENIALALPAEPMRKLSARIRAASDAYGLTIDPGRRVSTLSVGEKQRVEIIRCLLQNPRLLILDEPTSVLTPQEAELLFDVLRRLSGEGCAVLYISHRLDEVRALCNRATILRRGRVVDHCDPREESAASLAAKMVGEDVEAVERQAMPAESHAAATRLKLNDLSLPAADVFGIDLHDIALRVRAGEVVGIAGVAGEGQDELMLALSGERPTAAGMVEIDGKPVGALGPTARRRAGAAFVPEERNGHAAIGAMTLTENVLLSLSRAEGMAPGGILSLGKARAWMRDVRERFDVRSGEADPTAGSLSGGNLQKFVVGREIQRNPGVLVCAQPTWGVDAGAAAVIRRALIDLARSGAAVLVISQDLEEIFAICDRIAVIHRGRLSRAHLTEDMTAESIGLLMGGAHPEDAADTESAA